MYKGPKDGEFSENKIISADACSSAQISFGFLTIYLLSYTYMISEPALLSRYIVAYSCIRDFCFFLLQTTEEKTKVRIPSLEQ